MFFVFFLNEIKSKKKNDERETRNEAKCCDKSMNFGNFICQRQSFSLVSLTVFPSFSQILPPAIEFIY